MKRTIFGLILVVLFSGCNMNYIQTYKDYQNEDYDVRSTNLTFNNIDDIFRYVTMYIKWIDDKDSHGRNDYWQSPKETQEKRSGDCEDICIFVMYHANQLGYNVKMVGGVKGSQGHFILKIDEQYYEYDGYKIDNYLENCSYLTLDEALSVCYNKFGSRSIK